MRINPGDVYREFSAKQPDGSFRRAREIGCHACLRTETLRVVTNQFTGHATIKKFEQLGWRHENGLRWLCPQCWQARLERRKKDGGSMSKVEPINVPPRSLTLVEMRKVMAALDDHFNAEKGIFDPGWSDQRIADEVGVPRASVVLVRREAFGEIKLDPELQEIKAEIDQMLGKLAALSDRVAKIEEKTGK